MVSGRGDELAQWRRGLRQSGGRIVEHWESFTNGNWVSTGVSTARLGTKVSFLGEDVCSWQHRVRNEAYSVAETVGGREVGGN